jgi:succinate dehydrogenase/fumarate reductase cytochrome b subunit
MQDPDFAKSPRWKRDSKIIRVFLGLVMASLVFTGLTGIRNLPPAALKYLPTSSPAPYNASLGFGKVLLISLPTYSAVRTERVLTS